MNSAQQLWLEQVGNVLETLNQGVIINNERKQIVFANAKFLEMIKMSAGDLLGRQSRLIAGVTESIAGSPSSPTEGLKIGRVSR
jgi:nitrogen fixation/metabolism regulation signal transduction histidine kinase